MPHSTIKQFSITKFNIATEHDDSSEMDKNQTKNIFNVSKQSNINETNMMDLCSDIVAKLQCIIIFFINNYRKKT